MSYIPALRLIAHSIGICGAVDKVTLPVGIRIGAVGHVVQSYL